MNGKNTWDKFYKNTPLDKIPWNKTQADYLIKLLNAGRLGEGKALDLGCGVGRQSIALAKKGFEVVGVDISARAIKYARQNAKRVGVKIKFVVGDVINLGFLKGKEFDLVVDWANLHGIDMNKREKYVQGIVKHTRRGGRFLLRCFNRDKATPMELGMITVMGPVYFFSKQDIKDLFGKYFKILSINRSRSVENNKWFDEYLMERV